MATEMVVVTHREKLPCGHYEWRDGHCVEKDCDLYIQKCPVHGSVKRDEPCIAADAAMVAGWRKALTRCFTDYVGEHLHGDFPELTPAEFLDNFATYLLNGGNNA